jgi:hypothetical protein
MNPMKRIITTFTIALHARISHSFQIVPQNIFPRALSQNRSLQTGSLLNHLSVPSLLLPSKNCIGNIRSNSNSNNNNGYIVSGSTSVLYSSSTEMEKSIQEQTNGPRRSTRKRINSKAPENKHNNKDSKTIESGGTSEKSKVTSTETAEENEVSSNKSNKQNPEEKKKRTSNAATSAAKKPKKAKVEPQRITERDELKRLWDAEEALKKHGSYSKLVETNNMSVCILVCFVCVQCPTQWRILHILHSLFLYNKIVI